SRIATAGVLPSVTNDRCVPSGSVKDTTKSSIRSSLPSTFSPEDRVTTAVIGGAVLTVPAPPKRPPLPGRSHVCWSAFGSVYFVANPFRSPVTEWQEAHFVLKNASPALAFPTTISTFAGPVRLLTGKLWM